MIEIGENRYSIAMIFKMLTSGESVPGCALWREVTTGTDPEYYHQKTSETEENGVIVKTHSNGDPKYTVDEIKERLVIEVKEQAAKLISTTDWLISRKVETGTEIPQKVLDYRQAVRKAADEIENTVNAINDYDQIARYEKEKAYHTAWPSQDTVASYIRGA